MTKEDLNQGYGSDFVAFVYNPIFLSRQARSGVLALLPRLAGLSTWPPEALVLAAVAAFNQ